MVQMALALGLQPNMAAISGISGWYRMSEQFKQELGNIIEISPRYLALEPLLEVEPDFLFAGWNYGLKVGSELTPDYLSEFGINTLVLTESCAHVNKVRPVASMDLLFTDMLKLGKIFNRQDDANRLVAQWQQEIAGIKQLVASRPKQKVFLYDSGIEQPFTSGRYAMPEALISSAGGINVMSGNHFSWSNASWESVAISNPDLIILVDYGTGAETGIEQMKAVLKQHPLMKGTNAVKNQRFLLLSYGEITPGPDNIKAIKKIAASLYPTLWANADANG